MLKRSLAAWCSSWIDKLGIWRALSRAGRRALLIMGFAGALLGLAALGVYSDSKRLQSAPRDLSALELLSASAPTAGDPGVAQRASPSPSRPRTANFGGAVASQDARHMADWVVGRQDNAGAPFLIIDKREGRLFVFGPDGRFAQATPVLLGAAVGDDSYPGIGEIPVLEVQPFQRTTPAGRFVTQPGLDLEGNDIVWVDYDAAVAIHRVINKVRSERRPERLASPSAQDKRISFGCINVPIDFYNRRIAPVFGRRQGVAYILPEVKSFAQIFETSSAAFAPANTETLQPVAARGDGR